MPLKVVLSLSYFARTLADRMVGRSWSSPCYQWLRLSIKYAFEDGAESVAPVKQAEAGVELQAARRFAGTTRESTSSLSSVTRWWLGGGETLDRRVSLIGESNSQVVKGEGRDSRNKRGNEGASN